MFASRVAAGLVAAASLFSAVAVAADVDPIVIKVRTTSPLDSITSAYCTRLGLKVLLQDQRDSIVSSSLAGECLSSSPANLLAPTASSRELPINVCSFPASQLIPQN